MIDNPWDKNMIVTNEPAVGRIDIAVDAATVVS